MQRPWDHFLVPEVSYGTSLAEDTEFFMDVECKTTDACMHFSGVGDQRFSKETMTPKKTDNHQPPSQDTFLDFL